MEFIITISPFIVLAMGAIALYDPFWGVMSLVGGFFLADRGFAYFYFKLGPVPIFSAEAVLIGCLVHMFFVRFIKKSNGVSPATDQRKSRALFWFSTLFAAVGVQSLLRSLLLGLPVVVVFRDSALAYYALFAWILSGQNPSEKSIAYAERYLVATILFKTCYLFFGALVALPALTPEDPNPAAQSMYFSICILMAFAVWTYVKQRRVWTVALIMQGSVLLLQLVRTSWISLAAGYVVLAFLMRKSVGLKGVIKESSVVLIFAFLLTFTLTATKLARGIDSSLVTEEFHSFVEGKKSANVNTRLMLWHDAVAETFQSEKNDVVALPPGSVYAFLGERAFNMIHPIVQQFSSSVFKPFIGTPFGKEFRPPQLVRIMYVKRYDPHNSFVAIFYRMGLLGLIGFMGVVTASLASSYRLLRSGIRTKDHAILTGLFVSVIYILSHANWDVTFENAFKGGFLWIILGLMSIWRRRVSVAPSDQKELQLPEKILA